MRQFLFFKGANVFSEVDSVVFSQLIWGESSDLSGKFWAYAAQITSDREKGSTALILRKEIHLVWGILHSALNCFCTFWIN